MGWRRRVGACEEECHQPLTANIAVVENQETYWRGLLEAFKRETKEPFEPCGL